MLSILRVCACALAKRNKRNDEEKYVSRKRTSPRSACNVCCVHVYERIVCRLFCNLNPMLLITQILFTVLVPFLSLVSVRAPIVFFNIWIALTSALCSPCVVDVDVCQIRVLSVCVCEYVAFLFFACAFFFSSFFACLLSARLYCQLLFSLGLKI